MRQHSIGFQRLFATTLICTCAAATVALEKPNLQLVASVDRAAYEPNSTLRVEVEITNRGQTLAAIWDDFEAGASSISFVTVDSQRQVVGPLAINDSHLLDDGSATWRILKPGETVTITRYFLISELVAEPGEFTLEVRYVTPDDVESLLDLPTWDEAAGPLEDAVAFQVMRNR